MAELNACGVKKAVVEYGPECLCLLIAGASNSEIKIVTADGIIVRIDSNSARFYDGDVLSEPVEFNIGYLPGLVRSVLSRPADIKVTVC